MSNGVVAKRYAVALFELAKENNTLDQFIEDLRAVKQVFLENKSLQTVLTNPKVTIEKKKELLTGSFSGLSTHVLNTLQLLVDRHREDIVIDMVTEFVTLANDERGIAEATVYSVRKLTDDETKSFSEVFASKVGKQTLEIENIVDPSLIGGVKLRIGNRIYDGSVSGKLSRMEKELITNR